MVIPFYILSTSIAVADINRNAPCEHPSSASATIDVEILNGGELYMCDKCPWVMCYVYKSILHLRCEAFLVMFWI